MRKTKERKRIRPPDLAAVERVEPPTCPPTAEIRTRRARNLRIDRFLKSSPSRHLGQKLQIKNKTRNCMLDHLSPVFWIFSSLSYHLYAYPRNFFILLPPQCCLVSSTLFSSSYISVYFSIYFESSKKKLYPLLFFPNNSRLKKNHFLVYPLHS